MAAILKGATCGSQGFLQLNVFGTHLVIGLESWLSQKWFKFQIYTPPPCLNQKLAENEKSSETRILVALLIKVILIQRAWRIDGSTHSQEVFASFGFDLSKVIGVSSSDAWCSNSEDLWMIGGCCDAHRQRTRSIWMQMDAVVFGKSVVQLFKLWSCKPQPNIANTQGIEWLVQSCFYPVGKKCHESLDLCMTYGVDLELSSRLSQGPSKACAHTKPRIYPRNALASAVWGEVPHGKIESIPTNVGAESI